MLFALGYTSEIPRLILGFRIGEVSLFHSLPCLPVSLLKTSFTKRLEIKILGHKSSAFQKEGVYFIEQVHSQFTTIFGKDGSVVTVLN